MTDEQLAEALAELAVRAHRGKPPANVLKALGVIVRLASEGKAVKAKRASTRRSLNGHSAPDATAPD